MKRLLIFATTLFFVANANAAWRERSLTDSLTGKKTVQMENPALAPISYYGRTIVPRLSLQCLTPSDGTAAYVGAFIVFDEPLAVVPDAKMRLRIDDGGVENRIVGLSRRGEYIQIVAPEGFVFERLRGASRLRVEIPLLSGKAFMEFNTKGAEAAVSKARCSTPMDIKPAPRAS
jgi:hypothetical protein